MPSPKPDIKPQTTCLKPCRTVFMSCLATQHFLSYWVLSDASFRTRNRETNQSSFFFKIFCLTPGVQVSHLIVIVVRMAPDSEIRKGTALVSALWGVSGPPALSTSRRSRNTFSGSLLRRRNLTIMIYQGNTYNNER